MMDTQRLGRARCVALCNLKIQYDLDCTQNTITLLQPAWQKEHTLHPAALHQYH
jgi:hypothetical protein